MKSKTVCFIGHRKISLDETVLFGSRSEFDDMCHEIVTDLKEKYPFIERYSYAKQKKKQIINIFDLLK